MVKVMTKIDQNLIRQSLGQGQQLCQKWKKSKKLFKSYRVDKSLRPRERRRRTNRYKSIKPTPVYASVTSHSRAPYGLFPGCFEQKSYVHSRGPHGPRAAPYEFCLPVRGPQSFNACIISLRAPYGFIDCKQPVNSPCGARTVKYDARAGVLSILIVSIPLRVRKAAVRHPCGSRTGPVRDP